MSKSYEGESNIGLFLFMIQLLLIIVKLSGIFNWNWWLIFSPSLIAAFMVSVIFIIVAVSDDDKEEPSFEDRCNEFKKKVDENAKRYMMFGNECDKCGSYKPFHDHPCKYCTKIMSNDQTIKELKLELEKLRLRVRCLENCVYR